MYSLTSMPVEVCAGRGIVGEVGSMRSSRTSVSVTARTIVVVIVGSSTSDVVWRVVVAVDMDLDGASRSIVIGG